MQAGWSLFPPENLRAWLFHVGGVSQGHWEREMNWHTEIRSEEGLILYLQGLLGGECQFPYWMEACVGIMYSWKFQVLGLPAVNNR